MAIQSTQRTLIASLQGELPSLFESSTNDLQKALARLSKKEKFGEVARGVTTDFLGNVLDYIASRSVPSEFARDDVRRELKIWSQELGKVVERYSADWYSKNTWETKGEITQDDAHRFMAYALEKVHRQFSKEAPSEAA